VIKLSVTIINVFTYHKETINSHSNHYLINYLLHHNKPISSNYYIFTYQEEAINSHQIFHMVTYHEETINKHSNYHNYYRNQLFITS